ncbi:DDE domain-containing protein [Microvirga guangxiensis]|uniref:DDE domain-containing protein n=1 Tax=Microvirga guangxiensis TaxID=549386 RepID=A0A1G5KZJ5_9HYPH|nr:DDE domain-containing protein [Microvirga guangxiensis]
MIAGSQTNREAILLCDTADRLQDRTQRDLKPIRIRQCAYLNHRSEQDHRAIKRRVRSMIGFQSAVTARVILSGDELVHMMRKQQASMPAIDSRPLRSSLIGSPHERVMKTCSFLTPAPDSRLSSFERFRLARYPATLSQMVLTHAGLFSSLEILAVHGHLVACRSNKVYLTP